MIENKDIQQHVYNLVKNKIDDKNRVIKEVRVQTEWVLSEYIKCVNDNDDITLVLEQMIETLTNSLKDD